MLKLESNDKLGWIVLSDAKKVEDQKQDLEPVRVMGMVQAANIQLVRLRRGRIAIQFFPQSTEIKEAFDRLCTHLNDKQEAHARHKRAEEL